jgi:hypothetical protein
MTKYIGIYGITAMSLLYRLDNMIKCVCYMDIGSNGCFVTSAALMGNHYRTNIISSVGHPRSDLVVPLVLCMIVYNIWALVLYYRSIGIVSILLKMDNISSIPYMRVITYKTLVFMH